jgi:hypothetical protein
MRERFPPIHRSFLGAGRKLRYYSMLLPRIERHFTQMQQSRWNCRNLRSPVGSRAAG